MNEPELEEALPEFDRKVEVDRFLEADETVLGRLWQYEKRNLSPQQMADEEGTASTGWVSSYRTLVRVLRDGEVPTSPSVAQAAGRKVRAWLKGLDLSPQLREALVAQEELIMSRAEDRSAQAEEVEHAAEISKQAEENNTPGIYVYTLPHYLRHPYDPATGRTLLKVGHSSVDAYFRAGSQGRLTALPEDPILLRIYPVENSALAERAFHAWLRDADHPGSRARRGGSEWFVTSTKFLDRVARSMGLSVEEVNQFQIGEE
ncbi:GIY-YIG nuclease family protein [Nocardioides sp. NPDC127514]|uniref:GIY-YIG nuclease family protein n=1 Tax=unclassified Nocardioides TaxID=2615069 RepID=UPI0033232A49